FGDQLDLISTVANSDLGNLLRDTGYAVEALAAAAQAYQEDTSLTSYVHDGITVAITAGASDADATFSVDQPVGPSTVKVVAVAHLSVDEDDTRLDGAGSLVLQQGVVRNSELELAISKGNAQLKTVHIDKDLSESANGYDDTENLTVETIALELAATVKQINASATNPVTFAGALKVQINSGKMDSHEKHDWDVGSSNYLFDESISFETASIDLSGRFSDTQQHSVTATFSVQLSNPEGVALRTQATEDWLNSSFEESSSSELTETDTKYIGLTFSAGLLAQLPGVDTE